MVNQDGSQMNKCISTCYNLVASTNHGQTCYGTIVCYNKELIIDQCPSKYVMIAAAKLCLACPEDCDTCGVVGTTLKCTKCKDQYYLDNGNCLANCPYYGVQSTTIAWACVNCKTIHLTRNSLRISINSRSYQ